MTSPYPPGWYPDPVGRHALRWYDGDRYTDTVGNKGSGGEAVISHDPLQAVASPAPTPGPVRAPLSAKVVADRAMAMPKWARIALPIVVAIIFIRVASGGSGADNKAITSPEASTTTTILANAPSSAAGQVTSETTAPPATSTPETAPVEAAVSTSSTTLVPRAAAQPEITDTTAGGDYYDSCDAAETADVAPMYRGDPGYRDALDPDGDGVACDQTSG